ncbi:small multi-drug export protein [Actinopolyspora halophila]|uniref:small multi-drug export protein n=1 Tax=Actinopolyspora halophila TaxID=1850 RepID=UPI00036615D0|nr:small multi-drug export protein [Actinopolyspora halophila]
MTGANIAILLGVLVGGAAPWLEAVVVIPGGILAGVHPVPVVIAGLAGNLATVAGAAWFGERVRAWWVARRGTRAETGGRPDTGGRWQRVERLVRRWGLPALAVLGPIGLGTQLSALVAGGIGITPRAAFVWVGAGTVAWGVVAAIAAVTGVSLTGVTAP